MPTLSSLSQCTPPSLHPPFTVTWLHLMTGLTPAYRIKLISTKQGSVEGGGRVKKRKRRGGGRGNTTTGGQEKSTAGRRHNKEWAARWLVLGLMFCRMQGVAVGVGGGDDLFSGGEMGLAKGMGRLGLLVGVLRGANGLLNNVWVCGVRGDSRHCGNTSAQQLLCRLLASASLCLQYRPVKMIKTSFCCRK